MTSPLIEGIRPGSFVLTEVEPRTLSRDNVTFLTGSVYLPGQVLGQLTANGKFCPLDPSASTGAQIAAGISLYRYDASAADVKGVVIDRLAEVKANELVWPVGISSPNQAAAIAQLKALDILVR